ncbi:MAG: hypothetical protein WC522_05430 [Candidatus Omnitrophota bacterium]
MQINPELTFSSWRYWLWVAVMLIGQCALLRLPVQVAENRPVTRRPVIFLFAASGMAMGFLAAGFLVSIGEVITRDPLAAPLWWSALAVLLVVWSVWAYVFYKKSARLQPRNIIGSQCKYLFVGSILELLVAVPTHIIIRHRDYCCAGFSTFMGIAFGLAVMFFSFGPGVLFLYVERARRKGMKNII